MAESCRERAIEAGADQCCRGFWRDGRGVDFQVVEAGVVDTVSTVSMPSRRQVRMTRAAISPRLATSTRRNPCRPLTPRPAGHHRVYFGVL